MSKMHPWYSSFHPTLLMLGSSLCFGLMGLFVKLTSGRLSADEIAFFRSFGGLLILAIPMAWRGESFRGNHYPLLVLRSLTGSLALLFYFYAIAHIPLADAVMLNYTSPIFVALISLLVLRKPLSRRLMLALAIAIAGTILVLHPEGKMFSLGGMAGLLSGVFAAIAYLAINYLGRTDTSFTVVFYFSLIASLLTGSIMLPHFLWPEGLEWLWLGAIALSATVAQIMMTSAYRLGSVTTGSVTSLFTVVIASTLAFLFLGERPTFMTLFGSCLVLGGIFLLTQKPQKEATQK